MSANHQLKEAYQEWRRLAEAEGDAIRNHNWPLIADCQRALRQLQPLITSHTREAQQEWARLGVNRGAKETHFRTLLTELIEIESRNRLLLQGEQQAAREHVGQLERVGRKLRQVRRFYAPARPPAWTSFS